MSPYCYKDILKEGERESQEGGVGEYPSLFMVFMHAALQEEYGGRIYVGNF